MKSSIMNSDDVLLISSIWQDAKPCEEEQEQLEIETLNQYLGSLNQFNSFWRQRQYDESQIMLSNDEVVDISNKGFSIKERDMLGMLDNLVFNPISNYSELGVENCPFKITKCHSMGRQIVSSRDIMAGEVVIIEPPLILAPLNTEPFCLTCLQPTSFEFKCPECLFPFCNETCLNKTHKRECSFLARLEIRNNSHLMQTLDDKKISEKIASLPEDQRIGSLKMLLAMKESASVAVNSDILRCFPVIPVIRSLIVLMNSSFYGRVILSLQGHRIQKSTNQTDVINKIKICTENQCNNELIEYLVSVWDTNSFEVTVGLREKLQGIYPGASMLNHSCRANLQPMFTRNGVMVLRALENISNNTPLCIRYTDPLWPTRQRIEKLRKTKNFTCCCSRCKDSSEFGTFIGSVLCPECKSVVISRDPLDVTSTWVCSSSCSYNLHVKELSRLEMILSASLLKVTGEDLPLMIAVVKDLQKRLHAQNHIILRIYLNAITYHVKRDLTECRDEDIHILEGVTEGVMAVLRFLECPLSNKRARIGREYVRCKLEILRRGWQQNSLSKSDLRQKLSDISTQFDESRQALRWNERMPSMVEVETLYHDLCSCCS